MSTAEPVRVGGHAVGLPEGVYLAPLTRRLAAFAIDVLVPYALVLLGVMITVGDGPTVLAVVMLLLAIGWAVLLSWMVGTKAAGPGMRQLGLQIVGLHDGRPIGVGRALLRGVIISLLGLSFVGLIVLSALMVVQTRRQGWHDRAVDSVVIEERPLAPPRPRPAPAAADDAEAAGATADRTGERVDLVEDDAEEPVAAGARYAADPEPEAAAGAAAGGPEPESEPEQQEAVPSRAAVPAEPAWMIILEDGREIEIGRLVLIGRNPQPGSGEDDARLIKIRDEARTVSKTHLAIAVDGSDLLVTDRGSTNGSAVTDPDGGYQLLTADEPYRITDAGHLVSFGKHHVRIGRRA
ncbi:RDD family protein [Microlunatus soli]|uniref:RDD family protein n=1 Tax=Microlunatus soli TaxID=630515 RepID=UPI001560B678|nr:RDD family protein [Microlunatus soli]